MTAGSGALPQQVRLAVTVLLGLGGLLLLAGVVVLVTRADIADSVVSSQAPGSGQATETELKSSLTVVAGVFLGVGVVSLIAGYFLRRRKSWARLAGLAIGVLLGVLGVQFLLASGGDLLSLLLPVGALGVAVTLVSVLLSPPVATWLRGEPA